MAVPSGGGERRVEIALGLLAVLVPLAFHAAFFSSQALVYIADSTQLQFPRYRILCDALQHEHALPLWQNLLYGGMPFHASPENPTLYPPVVLFAALFPPVLVINLVILTGLAGAAAGMYLFVLHLWKRMGESPAAAAPAAFVAAQCFAMNHWTRVDHLNLVAYGHAHALIPWMLLAAERLLHGVRPLRSAGLLAILVACDVFTGGLYVFPYACLLLALWFLLHGLLGDPQARERTLRYGTLAVLLAGLMVLAKLVPLFEWAPTTNRHGALPYEDALDRTLGGLGEFHWKRVWENIATWTGGGWGLVPAILAPALVRHGVARTVVGLTLFFCAVALGSPAHRLLYALPAFDQIRGAWRAWSAVDALWPMASGLGAGWLVARFGRLGRSPWLAGLAGVVLGLALAARLFHSSERHDAVMHHPERYAELVARYVVWPRAAELAGADWRAFYVDKTVPQDHNEQFISTALGVETVAGYLGHVWPWRLARHVYHDAAGTPLGVQTRHRRLAVLSVRWFVTRNPDVPPAVPPERLFPVGIDGTDVVENPLARPRALAPAAVGAVVGDQGDEVLYALLDDPRLPLENASLIALGPGEELSRAELGALDVLVAVRTDGAAPDPARAAREAGVPVVEVAWPPNEASRAALTQVVERLAERAAREPSPALGFERPQSKEALVRVPEAARSSARFAVVSEPWSLYAGWRVSARGEELRVRSADGVVSAVLVPPGAGELRAVYRPRSVVLGLVLGALGLAGAVLCLVLRR